jgi:hypothetical protein
MSRPTLFSEEKSAIFLASAIVSIVVTSVPFLCRLLTLREYAITAIYSFVSASIACALVATKILRYRQQYNLEGAGQKDGAAHPSPERRPS